MAFWTALNEALTTTANAATLAVHTASKGVGVLSQTIDAGSNMVELRCKELDKTDRSFIIKRTAEFKLNIARELAKDPDLQSMYEQVEAEW